MTDAERLRLVRILGMLGSNFAGERDNAARFVEAFMARHGLTWAQAQALQSGEAAPERLSGSRQAAEPPRDWNPPDWSAYNETMPGICGKGAGTEASGRSMTPVFLFLAGGLLWACMGGFVQAILNLRLYYLTGIVS